MKIRFARHTNNLEKLTQFYISILGLKKLGEFINHSKYNGVFLGKENADWHIEFTESDENTNHDFDEDDLLVFYPDSKLEFDEIFNSLNASNIKIEKAKNPYWDKNGILFLDPDGYGIILSNQTTIPPKSGT